MGENLPIIAAFGNPLLDMSCSLHNADILKEFHLEPDSQCERSLEFMDNVLSKVKQQGVHCEYHPGGSALNMCRVLQQLIADRDQVMFCGAVGKDKNAGILKDLLADSGVRLGLQSLSLPTGLCICLINETKRSLVANIGAAEKYSLKHLQEPQMIHILQHVKYVYIEGYFIPSKFDICKYLFDMCLKKGSKFVLNISAEYICTTYPKDVKYLVERSDIIFGNRAEFLALAALFNKTDLIKMVQEMVHCCRKNAMCKKRFCKMIVITDGAQSVNIIYNDEDQILQEVYTVPEVKKEDIVDSTGAGDSFTAGYLQYVFEDKTPLECAENGAQVARQVLQQIGCLLPKQNLSKKKT